MKLSILFVACLTLTSAAFADSTTTKPARKPNSAPLMGMPAQNQCVKVTTDQLVTTLQTCDGTWSATGLSADNIQFCCHSSPITAR
jgi:hypothetical protein